MTWVQWLLLGLGVISVVAMVVIARRRPPASPWAGVPLGTDEEEETPGLPPIGTADSAKGPHAPRLGDAGAGVPSAHGRRAPAFRVNGGEEGTWSAFTPRADPAASVREVVLAEPQQKVILLHVVHKLRIPFNGAEVHRRLAECRLRHGMQDFYHRTAEINGMPESVFSVASMLKPGTLDPMAAQELKTPGLTFFMVLPGPVEGLRAYRDMVETAQELAVKLKADLLDDHRRPLTAQAIQGQLEDIARRERQSR